MKAGSVMTNKPHTPPQPVIEAVGDKPDFELMAIELCETFLLEKRKGIIEATSHVADTIQSAFEAGEIHNAINDHKDYQDMMERFSKFLDYATNGKLSKTTYPVEVMKSEMEAHVTTLTDEAFEAGVAQGRKDEREATHRHKKRGTEYVVIGEGSMQAGYWFSLPWKDARATLANAEPVDMQPVVVYQDVNDKSLWVRPKDEFEDGRFEQLPPQGDKK